MVSSVLEMDFLADLTALPSGLSMGSRSLLGASGVGSCIFRTGDSRETSMVKFSSALVAAAWSLFISRVISDSSLAATDRPVPPDPPPANCPCIV